MRGRLGGSSGAVALPSPYGQCWLISCPVGLEREDAQPMRLGCRVYLSTQLTGLYGAVGELNLPPCTEMLHTDTAKPPQQNLHSRAQSWKWMSPCSNIHHTPFNSILCQFSLTASRHHQLTQQPGNANSAQAD